MVTTAPMARARRVMFQARKARKTSNIRAASHLIFPAADPQCAMGPPCSV
ncbi:hypothetical protein RSPO_c00384 [Ralstonia solanacearum Po82]|uniref:Uncharacterized protein n=1 Tax=Ralstonia solanacearum (strain Po82) TaxID=1031711 RepID=F6G6Z3_RALS8|nr:hypothetical protein RSPO_c00384 [Ralstonia solanacearum Po82]